MFQTKVVQKIKTYNLFFWKIVSFMIECRTRQATDDNIIWHMRITYWTPKATDTHSEYVILIAFPLQHRLYVRALMLCVHCLSYLYCNMSSNLTENC